ncbi:hypothetical protein SPV1_11636 [Mariprofundus ferrooxydans PV-1]|uniref:Uncharacterized protein n=1 Tax=Mariprofundus ferrooxydans PV-1 TaxID=314345 RepID=Q0F109_9PROT|nr:hypothetical protein SPV1_11636 [Mariprofundus ferrooxydans PV-1]
MEAIMDAPDIKMDLEGVASYALLVSTQLRIANRL